MQLCAGDVLLCQTSDSQDQAEHVRGRKKKKSIKKILTQNGKKKYLQAIL
jgi:hypothetical protein